MGEIDRFKEMPDYENLSPEDANKGMHVAHRIVKGTILMARDTIPTMV
ncbi:MAG: hypothetical protein H7096_09920 [Flavobacterium sp.]|nr:hypothetical protein [Pedobacter sp.]